MTPEIQEAIEFLKRFHPDGPWLLFAKTASGFHPAAVGPHCPGNVEGFLHKHKSADLYFLLGDLSQSVSKKPEKDDMAGSRWLWVDLDPRAGEELEEERTRMLGRLTTNLPRGAPTPTVIIDSGRGYWGLWRLAERCEDGPLLERYNKSLETLFGADHCSNIDRVARLPYTTNQKTGRRATVVEFNDNTYTLADMPEPVPDPATAPVLSVDAANARRVESLDELVEKWQVRPETCAIINYGHDPNNPGRWPSRSEAVYHVCCELVRHEVPDEVILGLLLDDAWSISASVLDKGRKAQGYAAKQVASAHRAIAEDTEPELRELNDRHAVLTQEGGKTRVLAWDEEDGRTVPVLQTFDDFRNRYMNRRVQVGTSQQGLPVKKPLGVWWLEHPRRRQYKALRFDPKRDEEFDGYLNLWQGWPIDPRPGDWSLMKRHVEDVLAAGDEVAADYILRWAAWTLQNPDRPAEVALVLKGGRGTGKGVFARAIKDLFGPYGLQINSPTQLTGRFNAHLRNCCLLFADEAVVPGHKEAESALKGLITEPELTIEGKGVNVIQTPNRLHVIMASNDDWVVPAGVDERRFAVFDVADIHQQDSDYFSALARQMEDGGLAAMMYDLLRRPLGGRHPRQDIPDTAALRGQKEHSLDPFQQFLLGVLESGEVAAAPFPRRAGAYFSNDQGAQPGLFTAMRRSSPRLRDMSDHRLGKALKEWGCLVCSNGRSRGWAFPPLDEMREEWDRRFGPRQWSGPVAWRREEETYDDLPF